MFFKKNNFLKFLIGFLLIINSKNCFSYETSNASIMKDKIADHISSSLEPALIEWIKNNPEEVQQIINSENNTSASINPAIQQPLSYSYQANQGYQQGPQVVRITKEEYNAVQKGFIKLEDLVINKTSPQQSQQQIIINSQQQIATSPQGNYTNIQASPNYQARNYFYDYYNYYKNYQYAPQAQNYYRPSYRPENYYYY